MPKIHAGQRNDQAHQRGHVFEQNGKYGRVAAVAQGLPKTGVALGFAKLAVGQVAGRALKHHRQAQHPVVPGGVGERRGVLQVLVAFVERHAAAHGKNHHGHNHRPEIQVLAVAKGVAGIGRLLAAVQAEQNQPAVAAVDQRVNALRQHGRAAREISGHKLGDGNGHIGRNGAINHDFRRTAGH